jgi:hypothetical protein
MYRDRRAEGGHRAWAARFLAECDGLATRIGAKENFQPVFTAV